MQFPFTYGSRNSKALFDPMNISCYYSVDSIVCLISQCLCEMELDQYLPDALNRIVK